MSDIDRNVVIAQEQRAVDHAYACHEAKHRNNRRLREPAWNVTDSEAGTNFIPDVASELLSTPSGRN